VWGVGSLGFGLGGWPPPPQPPIPNPQSPIPRITSDNFLNNY